MSAVPTRALFLYGTLQPGADTPMSRWLAARVRHACPATLPGRMVAVPSPSGWYPALLHGGTARCHGTLVHARLSASELARLDHYEGREYRRCTAHVRRGDGRLRSAAVYRWSRNLPRGCERIAGGDFLEWLRKHRRRAYGTQRRH